MRRAGIHKPHPRATVSAQSRQPFTLIELLVVVSIIAVLAALLLPALSRARERAKRVLCMSQVRQLGLGASEYADQNDTWFPAHHGSFGVYLHHIQGRAKFRAEFMGGEPEVFYCPSAKYIERPSWGPHHPANLGDGFFAYYYFGGYGGDTRKIYQPWGGWRYGLNTDYWPSPSLKLAAAKNTDFTVRPLFMDAASLGDTYNRQGAFSTDAFPANNHTANGVLTRSVYENVLFLDLHAEGIPDPPSRPYRHSAPGGFPLHW